MAAHFHVGDEQTRSVDRQKPIDRAAAGAVENRFHTAQISEPFFSHIRDKSQRTRCLDGCTF